MQQIPRISEAEWRVMKIIWQRSKATSADVIEALSDVTDWKDKTIKTLLNRLVSKKVLGYDRNGRAYQYYALVTEDDCVREESRSFLDRVHNGAIMPMLASFLEDQKLSKSQIKDLRRLLDEKEAK